MILVDTNVLVAMASQRDALHARAMELMTQLPAGQLVLPTVLAEACYLIEAHVGSAAEAALLDSFADGDFTLGEVNGDDLARMGQLIRQYADLGLGATDSSIVSVAERLMISETATFDRRHFSVVRPAHVPAFRLLPD